MAREEVMERKMFTEVTHATRTIKAIRMGLIVMSWVFVALGFMLPHHV